MRPVEQWTVDDLKELVRDQVQESLVLDYKRSDSLGRESKHRNEISKDVSAFANSAGGRIIYGVVEQNSIPVSIDNGTDDAQFSRETLEQVISSNIQPRVSGVVIKPIPLGGGRSAWVIEIPPATTFAPHQAADRKYYRRFNFESVPMYDHEIRDVLRRATTGHPVIWFAWEPDADWAGSGERGILMAHITNAAPECPLRCRSSGSRRLRFLRSLFRTPAEVTTS